MKRAFDLVVSGLALVAFAPLLLPLLVVLRLTGEGEIFYRQARIGRYGRPFNLLKFATMLKDSPNLGTGHLTTRDDPRVLPVGRLLRKTKLNELPQLLNVLRGDMSIVGPRPQTPDHVALFPDDLRDALLSVRPGLSGIGSIVFRDEELLLARSARGPERFFAEVITPYKAALESWYVESRSLRLDLQLMYLTVLIIILPRSKVHWEVLPGLPEPPRALRDLGIGPPLNRGDILL